MKDKMINRRRQIHCSGWLYHALFLSVILIVAVKFLFQLMIPSEIVLILLCLMVCIGDLNQVLGTCCMCLSLTTTVTHDYVLLLAAVLLAVRFRAGIRVGLSVLPVMLMMIWELLHGFFWDFSVSQLIVIFVPFILCCILMGMDTGGIDYGFIVRRFAICNCAVCVILVGSVLVRANFNFAATFINMQRLGLQEEGSSALSLVINPNSLGVLCTLAICGLLQLMTVGRQKRFDLWLIILMVICGALTLSRTYLVLLMLTAVLFVFAQKRGMKYKLRILMAVAAVAAAAVALLYLIFPATIEQMLSRFQGSDITSGRTSLFSAYNAYVLSDPGLLFWGVGLTNFADRITGITGLYNPPHNGIQEVIVAWGLPGLCLLGFFGVFMYISARRKNGRIGLINWIPFILLMAKIQVGQMLTSGYTVLALIFAYLSLAHDFTGNKNHA